MVFKHNVKRKSNLQSGPKSGQKMDEEQKRYESQLHRDYIFSDLIDIG